MSIKKKLENIRYTIKMIEVKEEELEKLQEMTKNLSQLPTDMPSSPTKDVHRVEDIIIKMTEIENNILDYVEALVDERNKVSNALEKLESVDERLVLEMRYFHNEKWSDIANEINLSERQTYRIHDKALETLKMIS